MAWAAPEKNNWILRSLNSQTGPLKKNTDHKKFKDDVHFILKNGVPQTLFPRI